MPIMQKQQENPFLGAGSQEGLFSRAVYQLAIAAVGPHNKPP